VHNAIIHEYEMVRREVGSMPPVDRARYLQAIAAEMREMENPLLRAKIERLLGEQGPLPAPPSAVQTLRRLKRWTRVLSSSPLQPLWRGLSRRLRLWPPGENSLEFPSREEALDHARRFPRRPYLTALHLRALLGTLQRMD
jgi:hypothetical protein